MTQAVRDGRAGDEEVRMPAAALRTCDGGGAARWYRIEARPLTPGTGKSLIAWSVADISSERAEQEEAIFQELQHAIDYLDHAPAGFFSAEPDGRIVYINATLAEWLGMDIARFEAGSLDPGGYRQAATTSRSSPASLTGRGHDRTDIVDLDLVKRDGRSLPVRLLHRVPVTADGAPGATRTIVLNRSPGEEISEASEALRASEVRFARFFNSTPIAIAAIDRRAASSAGATPNSSSCSAASSATPARRSGNWSTSSPAPTGRDRRGAESAQERLHR